MEKVYKTDNFFSQPKHPLIEINGRIYTDTIPPRIDSMKVISQNEIYIKFNESIDSISANSLLNYSTDNGIGSPDSVFFDQINNSVILYFANNFAQLV